MSYNLKAMQYGSRKAAQQVPRILQVLELYQETKDQFTKKVSANIKSVLVNF